MFRYYQFRLDRFVVIRTATLPTRARRQSGSHVDDRFGIYFDFSGPLVVVLATRRTRGEARRRHGPSALINGVSIVKPTGQRISRPRRPRQLRHDVSSTSARVLARQVSAVGPKQTGATPQRRAGNLSADFSRQSGDDAGERHSGRARGLAREQRA